jgi:hypothetical protein
MAVLVLDERHGPPSSATLEDTVASRFACTVNAVYGWSGPGNRRAAVEALIQIPDRVPADCVRKVDRARKVRIGE